MYLVYIKSMKPFLAWSRWFLSVLAAVAGAASAAEFRDPTAPYHVPGGSVASTGPVLQSTVVSETRRTALISGRYYNVGDRLGNSVIREIRPYQVVLESNGRTTYLRLVPDGVKVPHSPGKE